jgi:hypothetical protein
VVALVSAHGRFLCADDGSKVTADRKALGPWESFVCEPIPTAVAIPGLGNGAHSSASMRLALRAHAGTYVSCAGGTHARAVLASYDESWLMLDAEVARSVYWGRNPSGEAYDGVSRDTLRLPLPAAKAGAGVAAVLSVGAGMLAAAVSVPAPSRPPNVSQ